MAAFVGVDFGTRCIEVYLKDKGIVLREPNVAAVDTRGNVIAVGSEALLIRGRAPGTVTVRRPIINGEITDFNLTAEILDHCLEIAAPRQKKHVIAAVKYGFNERGRELLTRALGDCRTGHVKLVDSALAAFLGIGIQFEEDEYTGNIVCDIGAGSVEAAYVRGGELLRVETSTGGEASDAAIALHITKNYGLAVNVNTVREAKHKLSLYGEDALPLTLAGLDRTTGMPRKITLDSAKLLQPAAPQIEGAATALERLLANLPHHGTEQSTADKIVLIGGGSMLTGIDEYVSQRIGGEVTLADTPLDCVANGLGIMLEHEEI